MPCNSKSLRIYHFERAKDLHGNVMSVNRTLNFVSLSKSVKLALSLEYGIRFIPFKEGC